MRLLIGTTATKTKTLSRIDAETPRQVPREKKREDGEEAHEGVPGKIEAAGALLCSRCSQADGRLIVSYEHWRLCGCTDTANGALSPQDVRPDPATAAVPRGTPSVDRRSP